MCGIKGVEVKKYIIIGILITLSFQLFAKGEWISGLGSTFGYNTKELQLWKFKAESTVSRGLYFKFGYQLSLGKKFSASITPGIQQHYDIVEINETKVDGYSYNFDIPLDVHYQFHPKWSSYMGFSIQDYRPIKDVSLNKSYNVRLNFNLGLVYHFSNVWAMDIVYSRIVSDKIDSFVFTNYTNHVCLGMRMNLQVLKKRNHE